MNKYKLIAIFLLSLSVRALCSDIWISTEEDSELTAGFHTRRKEHPRSIELGYDKLYNSWENEAKKLVEFYETILNQ